MENRPLKHRGFRQGLHQESSTAKERVGQVRFDGLRAFRYAKAGEALTAGNLNQAPQLAAAHVDEAILAAVAVGTKQLQLTITAGTAIAENQLVGGFFQINSGTGMGFQYLIDGNSALSASGTTIYITLEEPGIMSALDTTSTYNLAPNPNYGVLETATDENVPTGVPPINVTSGYYFWNQVSGVAMVLQTDSAAVGTTMIVAASSGGVVSTGTSWDVDVPVVGVKVYTAATSADYGPVQLLLL